MIYNLLLIVRGMKFKIIKKNKKQRRANQGNYQPQNKYEEVEIEYAPEEIIKILIIIIIKILI